MLGLNGSNQPNRMMVTGSVGELLKLDCGEYSSLPSATVTWSKSDCELNTQLSLGENVVTSVESGSIYFRSLTTSHAGCFRCTVTNSVSGITLTGSYELIVNGKFVSFSVQNFY